MTTHQPSTGKPDQLSAHLLAAAAAGDIERLRELVAPPPLLTIANAAAMLVISKRQVWRLLATGDLDKFVVGRASRVTRASIERLIARGGAP